MKLELQLSEIEYLIKKFSKHSIKIKYIGYNEIEVSYCINIKIAIKEVHDYSVSLNYTPSSAAKLLLKGAKYMIKKKLDENIFSWNIPKKEIYVNILHIDNDVLKELLKIYHISNFEIRNNEIFLELVN